ncbi:hypothetical protein NW762_012582 [Fusarium torreyae]|uniref:Xylanolytic transcriptional activator regulatory domain-containing protein n=1 Tax=Fusarium torreyae TaxID=1237075 RepID=A0A9W8VB95_9HYPO|nr:hypothetical protein NW762_012582 [Fusarium torreyae]
MASSLTSSLQQNQHLPPAIDSRRSSTVRFGDKYHPAIDDHCDEWYQPFSRCEKLGFLVDSLSSENLHLQPEQEAVRPLLETYKRLCQAVQDDQENEPFGSNWASTQNAARDMLPCRRTCDALLDAYIKTFESVLRIVHVPSFLRDYEHFWENSTSSAVSNDETFECKLLLAAALGSTTIVPSESQRFQAISLREQANSWIAYAKDWLARRTIKGMRADLSMAQISCLLALTRHTHPQDAAPMGVAWLSEGHGLTHIAVQMGLHREPRSRSSCMSVKEAEIRRRLWATMLELSIQISVDQGLPAPLAPESYDCEAPSSIADDDLYLGIESQDATSSTVLMLLVQTQRLRLRILQLVNAPGSSKTYQECCTLATELNAAYCSSLEKLTSMGKTPPTDFQVKLMDVFTRPFVLALHEPFAEQACAKPEYYYSQRMRMEVSAQLLKSPMNQGSYAALLTHGHGHFLLAQRKATMSLCLDLIREQEENSFPSLDSASRRQLRDVLLGSVDIFQRRVRATGGADSTVEFLLFSCAVACIEAMQQNSGRGKINEAILEAAKTGLSFCCGTMERQRRRESRPGSRPSEKIGEPDLMQMLMG